MNFLKNVFGYGDQSEGSNPQLHKINGKSYQELTLIAEGGYGYIWRALDVNQKKIVILKKQLCQNEQTIQQTEQEIKLHKQLGTHINIVECFDGSIVHYKSRTYALTVMEYCEGGTLFDLLHRHREKQLSEVQILFIMKHLVSGLRHMHQQKPPIAHRDLKVENILLHEKVFKLCDFGSACNEVINLSTVSKLEASRHQEIFEKNTTMMYRPPEMSDLYQKFEVSEKVDIWMLGCVLYTMCFYEHPFQEASTLAIIQADYKIPKGHKFTPKMLQLISILLTPKPSERPSIHQIEYLVTNYGRLDKITHSLPLIKENTSQNISQTHEAKPELILDDFDDFQVAPSQQMPTNQNTNNLIDF